MRRITELTVVILIITVLVVSASAQVTFNVTVSSHGTIKRILWLRTDNQSIVDEENNVVALRGIAAVWDGYVYNLPGIEALWEDRLEWMNNNGYTSVRLRFDFNTVNLDYLDRVVDLFEAHGVYIVLSCVYGYDLKEHYDDGSWITDWVNIADRYKDRSVIAAYELANEGYWADGGGDPVSCRQAFKECISAIRQVDDKHILMIYEPIRNWRIAELAFEGVSWYQDDVLWRLDDLPQDDNIAFKFGYHWTVIRSQSEGSVSYEYYKDKFDIAQAYAQDYVYCLIKWREYFNMPVFNYEFGDYDDDPTHANYAGWEEIIELCNEQCIPWNYHWLEHWENYYPDTWKTKVVAFAGSYSTPYYGTPQAFDPDPFNQLEYILDYKLPWNQVGPGRIWLVDSNYWITLSGPCTVRVRIFDGYPDERTLTNMIGDNLVTVNAGENVTLQGVSGENRVVTPYSAP